MRIETRAKLPSPYIVVDTRTYKRWERGRSHGLGENGDGQECVEPSLGILPLWCGVKFEVPWTKSVVEGLLLDA